MRLAGPEDAKLSARWLSHASFCGPGLNKLQEALAAGLSAVLTAMLWQARYDFISSFIRHEHCFAYIGEKQHCICNTTMAHRTQAVDVHDSVVLRREYDISSAVCILHRHITAPIQA